MMSRTDGPGGAATAWLIGAPVGLARTPKAKAPPATWPSTWEKVRHETV